MCLCSLSHAMTIQQSIELTKLPQHMQTLGFPVIHRVKQLCVSFTGVHQKVLLRIAFVNVRFGYEFFPHFPLHSNNSDNNNFILMIVSTHMVYSSVRILHQR